MRIPHPIPYQGSKRVIAGYILQYLPHDVGTLIEPFAGSAAVSIAVASDHKAAQFVINDINKPLIGLWDQIINHPERIARGYELLWEQQLGREREFYDEVRDIFNRTQRPDCLLYLLARCVKAAIRYNSNGEFNQSPDNRRRGVRPATMLSQIARTSRLLKGRTKLACTDYRTMLQKVSLADVVYMDPPYQGVCGGRDRRYSQVLSYGDFVETLEKLNSNNVSFIVSYDGRTGTKKFGKPLPPSLKLAHIEINAGKSSQATLLGRDEHTFESLYLSHSLVTRIGKLGELEKQPVLFTHGAKAQITLRVSQAS